MSDIGAAFRTYAIAQTSVSTICGTRIYPDVLPQGCTMPAAVYYAVGGDTEQQLAATNSAVGLEHTRLQVDCYSETRTQANSLSNAIKGVVLAAPKGTWGTVSVAGATVSGGERYDTQTRETGSDDVYYICSRDYLVSFKDA